MTGGLLGQAVVVGAAGGFGRAFVAMLAGAGGRVTGVDVVEVEHAGYTGLVADASRPGPALSKELAGADVVLMCLPERSLFPALEGVVERLSPGALLVDITSVKTRYAAAVTALREDVELCSLEPLFAPDVGFEGQQVLLAELRPGPRSAAFARVLELAGAELIRLDIDAIDRQAAASQVAAHAALLAYGQALGDLGHSAGGPRTALQRALLTLVARVATRDPEVYWHIQRDNPHAAGARAALRRALGVLDGLVGADDLAGFSGLLGSVQTALGPQAGQLAGRSAAVVSAASAGAAGMDADGRCGLMDAGGRSGLMDAERRLQVAMIANDLPALDGLLDDRLVITSTPALDAVTKGEDLAARESGRVTMNVLEQESLDVVVSGQTGVTRLLARIGGTSDGTPFGGRVLYTRTWHHTDHRGWRVLAAHVSPAPSS